MAKHLWEVEHDYHCELFNYFSNECHDSFDSWTEFKGSDWFEADADYNLLFRWDWLNKDGQHKLHLFYIKQRKGIFQSVTIYNMLESDEDEVRTWLLPKLDHLKRLWEPLTEGKDSIP